MGRTREVGLLVLAALGCLAAAPALAAATKWCVGEPTCLAEGGVKEQPNGTGLQEALEAATKGTSPREIVIGPGTYSAGKEGFSYSGSQVIIRGAGAGATVLTRAPESGPSVLSLSSAGSTAKGLSVLVPEHENEIGAVLNQGTMEGVTIEAPPGAANAFGLELENGTFTHGVIDVTHGTGLSQRGGEALYSSISAQPFGVQAATHPVLRADRISSSMYPLVSYYAEPLVLEDSILDMEGTAEVGAEIVANAKGTTDAMLRQDAIVGGGHTGIYLVGENAVAAAEIEDTIISEVEVPIHLKAEGSGIKATIFTDYSSYEKAKDEEGAQATLTDAHPVSGVPSFVSPLTGDFHLAPGSPLIDAGKPGTTLEPWEFTTDLEGNPRIVHGRRDVGPYEYRWRAPVLSASANVTSATTGTAVKFSGSASDPEPGDTIASYQWTFDDGASVPAGATATHAFSTPGVHTATLTATDALGLVGMAKVSVTVEALPRCSLTKCGGRCVCREFGLSSLAVSPDSFRAARRGASVGHARTGAGVRYTLLGGPGTVRFTVIRRQAGVRVGKRCLAPAKGRHGRRCTRLVRVAGSFEQRGRSGANSFRFTGRIGGRTLSPGSYFLVATTSRGGRAYVAEALFSVRG